MLVASKILTTLKKPDVKEDSGLAITRYNNRNWLWENLLY
jgi:hypothetical protein